MPLILNTTHWRAWATVVVLSAGPASAEEGAPDLTPENGSGFGYMRTVAEGIEAVDAAGGRQTIRIGGGTYSVGSSVISTPCTLAGWRDGPVVIGQ